MSSIFRKDDNHVDKPNRNTFDLSYQNNLTTRFGKLIPCFCQEVIPGDSFRIKPTFGLRFLPQVFPVQTRMRAHLHFFYVRNRTLWKDWMDFIGKTKTGLTLPYLQFNDPKKVTESSIFDYMGLPVTVQSKTGKGRTNSGVQKVVNFVNSTGNPRIGNANSTAVDTADNYIVGKYSSTQGTTMAVKYFEFIKEVVVTNDSSFVMSDTAASPQNPLYLVVDGYATTRTSDQGQIAPSSEYTQRAVIRLTAATGNITRYYNVKYIDATGATITARFTVNSIVGYYYNASLAAHLPQVDVDFGVNLNYPLASLRADFFPYNLSDLRISALPFRAYEAVYNSFYRNPENNPLILNGTPEYNKYVTSDAGGAQPAESFDLFLRNWEDDAFTTAVPTPQQGDAPRVGLTGSPNDVVYLHYANEDGTVGSLHLSTNPNGNVIQTESTNKDDRGNSLAMALNDAVNFGITINDLRNVNALQLWLEKNVRKGYRYRDQLMSHYGIKVSYNDLMMPEFIGGVSRDVSVNQISQTVETDTGNLGDMAGQSYVVGDGKEIDHFCDEHGYIIGIMSIAPVPNYSQLIPKHLFKHDTFDFFFPEFGKIGMQPILNREIAALASHLAGSAEETFGYQRAWYDYLANVDQVHGKFNSEFYNFLLQRKFADVPQLGASFTTINPDDLNNIFYRDDDEDKILGQIYFDVKAIRPIPLFGIPAIE